MAGAAGPPLFLVNMQHMKVFLSVSEIRYILRYFSRNHRFFVAEETEVVLPFFIGRIKTVWEGKPENVGVVRAVRIVARNTIALNNRTVLKPPLFPYAIFLMAAVT